MNIEYSNKQKEIIKSNNKFTLVCAGAGTGKTTTIIGKIDYLIKNHGIKEHEIICITFTKEAVNNLKYKLKDLLNYNIKCYTFHKFSLNILKGTFNNICDSTTLEYIIEEFFRTIIYDETYLKLFLKYSKRRFNKNNYRKKYKKIKTSEIEKNKKIIKRFLELFKTRGFTYNNLKNMYNEEKSNRYKSLLLIIIKIYLTYQEELISTKTIDYNDMINNCIKYLKNNNINDTTKYLIIDEFQDTSDKKIELIKEYQRITNCNIFAVGDDFQSIYKFTGCNLDIFLNFKNYFPNAKTLKLEETYRNSMELITIAGNFIMKNKKQIKKILTSKKHIDRPIEIIYYKNINKAIIKLIDKIYRETKKPILILGRNNFDIYSVLKSNKFIKEKENIIYIPNKNIKLKYLTIHSAKGLEEENVILINLLNSKNGFPNKKENEHILKYVQININELKYSEERRLFYVALTRTKNKNYIMTKKGCESIFIKELIKKNKKHIKKTSL